MAPKESNDHDQHQSIKRRRVDLIPPSKRTEESTLGFHLKFCQQMTKEYESVNIENWSKSWRDGLAFCALVHHFSPESFDFNKLNSMQREENYRLAFTTASKFGIDPLLDVEELMKADDIDPRCCFTYVQQFYNVFRFWDDDKSDRENQLRCLFIKNTSRLRP